MRYLFFSLCPLLCFGDILEDEALFLNRIADFWEEGEYEIARNQIHEFLSLYPNSSSSDSLNSAVGDVFLREKNYTQALESYAKITDPKVIERILPHKMQCLYALKQYDMIANTCEQFLQNVRDDLQMTYYLSIALYQQSLISSDREAVIARAIPYFEKLMSSPFKTQIAAPYAHLLFMQKNFPKAADVYLELAKNGSEETLFQAGLIQAEYDKELSLKTFDSIKNLKPESAYNCLVLSFDLQKYEELINAKESFLQIIPRTKIPMAHLLFGRSFFALQKYTEACHELEQYIATQEVQSESLHSALLTFLEASIQNKDLSSVENSIAKFASFYPQDEAIIKGKLAKATLLCETNQFGIAKQELEALPKTPEVLLELTFLCNQMGDCVSAREYALLGLMHDPHHALMKKYFIHASTVLANGSVEGKRQLIDDLKKLDDPSFSYFLAKTYFNLREYHEALPLFVECCQYETDSETLNDMYLMMALCYRDGFQDLQNFCLYAEKVSPCGQLHSALYNAYLELSVMDKAVHHLHCAFNTNIPISSENLFWLSIHLPAPEAMRVLESIHNKTPEMALALSKLYLQSNRNEEAIALLENITDLNDAALLLGEIYVKNGMTQEAQTLFAKICADSSSLKTYIGASACLLNLRLQPISENVLSQYKNLILQKNISHEPLYLEAALDYVNLQALQHGNDPTKKLALLRKIKYDFETTEDLLSRDYHAARQQNPEQDAIYHFYMNYLEAEMLNAQSTLAISTEEQKALQAKAQDILMKIVEEKAPQALVERANQCLNP